ncbi:phage holin family protein [Cyanobium sp. NS01]|uniref:phage holin family protein n=1 Tax=Cyanobium sp. NS01 TaxID=261284 RepID=UPI001648A7ED|nr:phage holin family protein [Cyanobium sp. NS01]QNI69688.1 putative conserved membrane protein/ phage holin family [Cyanobium sp. NS01]
MTEEQFGERERRNGGARVAMGRIGSLMTSVMDLHVRIALQEADSEKRRLITGALLLSGGLTLMLLSLIGAELALLLWLHEGLRLSWIRSALAMAGLNVVLAGVFLRIGGGLLKGPYLPQTTAGLTKTTRALLGR